MRFLDDDLTRRRVRSRADSLRAWTAAERRRLRRNWSIALLTVLGLSIAIAVWTQK